MNFSKDKNLENSISLITYNTESFGLINGKSDNDKDENIINFIKTNDADLLVIQEFWNLGLKEFSQYPYYFIGYRENIVKSTQIIFSKYPIVNKGYIDFPNTVNNAMFVDIKYNNEVLRVYNLHLESFRTNTIHQLNNPNSYNPLIKRISIAEKVRKKQAQLVVNHINLFEGKVIICGDFNSTQFSSVYRDLKKNRNDSFIEKGFGFGETYKLFKYPFRLDYVLMDNDFEILSHENFNLNFSDHEPVKVRFKLN